MVYTQVSPPCTQVPLAAIWHGFETRPICVHHLIDTLLWEEFSRFVSGAARPRAEAMEDIGCFLLKIEVRGDSLLEAFVLDPCCELRHLKVLGLLKDPCIRAGIECIVMPEKLECLREAGLEDMREGFGIALHDKCAIRSTCWGFQCG